MKTRPLIAKTDKGLYCEKGDFYIDPHRAVETAVITHAHSDHARRGSRLYLSTETSVGLLKVRLGQNTHVRGLPYREVFQLGSVQVSFHPAGHILGSAQVRVQSGSEVWVASGDYKRDFDPSCEPFESVRCDTFITEATFGTPKYAWRKDAQHGQDLFRWWKENAQLGSNSLLFGYSLGKAQRILAELAPFADRPVVIHDSIQELSQCYRQAGRTLSPTIELSQFIKSERFEGELILAPPSILQTDSIGRLGKFKTAFASGWMQATSSGGFGRQDYDHGFVISDHADWSDLNRTIDETQATQVFVQHRDGALVRHLRRRGIDAHSDTMLETGNYERLGGCALSLFGSAP